MKNLDKGHIYLILATLSALFSYLIVTTAGFPYLGLSFSLATLTLLVYHFKTDKTPFFRTLSMLTLLLSLCIFYRANGFLTFLNLIATLFFGSLMGIYHNDTLLSFIHFAFAPLITFFNSFRVSPEYIYSPFKFKLQGTTEILKSLTISVALLAVIIPLLTSANPFFNKLVLDTFKFFNLSQLLENLLTANYILWLIRLVFFLVFVLFIPHLLTYINRTLSIPNIPNFLQGIHLLLPKILVFLVIAIFFITQAQLYFSTDQTLQTLGYTNSQYVNEVFAQLTIVTIIIIALIYNDKSRSSYSQLFTYLLLVECFFLAGMALKSVYDYTANYGLTHKRLWGYMGVFWVTSILSFFVYTYRKRLSDNIFIKATLLLSAFTLLAVNILNFDYMIYHYSQARLSWGTDYPYLSRLSPDAHAYKDLSNIFKNKVYDDNTAPALSGIIWRIDELQYKYHNLDLRTFNLSEYVEYQSVKDINTSELQKLLNSYYNQQFNSDIPPHPVTPAR
jgi:hypothetical protein